MSVFSALLPAALYLDRILMGVLAVWILVRCCRSLFPPPEEELWGVIRLVSGVEYPLTHWENTIGRARSCDICLHFPSVSRHHANLCRSDRGVWRLLPIPAAGGVLVNEVPLQAPTELHSGDSIVVGGITMYFYPADTADELRLTRSRTEPGLRVSRAGTLWLLTLFQLLTLLQFLPGLSGETAFPIVMSFAVLCVLMWFLYLLYRACSRTAFEAETLAFFLTTVNFAIAAAHAPESLFKQLAAVAAGMLLFLCMSLVLRDLPLSTHLRWPVALLAAGLLIFNLLFGQKIFGARNWISLGPVSVQPSEFVKLAFVLVGSATLDRLFARRNLIFTVLFSGFCIACLALMSDFGTALVFFVAFLCIAFLRTGDLASIVMASAAAAAAGGIVLHFKPYIADRFTVWRHVWEYTSSTGYQQSRTMSAIATGGLFGLGPERSWLKHLGAANTDLVFGVVGEEFGLLIALCCTAVIVVLTLFTLRCAATARSSFYTIASCAAAAMLTCQTLLNVLGSVDLLPLTGVTFPFVSMGGSSAVTCWGLLAYLKAADTRPAASFTVRLPKGWRKAQRQPDEAPDNVPDDAAFGAPGDAPAQQGAHEDFFARRPDIPVEDIFGKAGDTQ